MLHNSFLHEAANKKCGFIKNRLTGGRSAGNRRHSRLIIAKFHLTPSKLVGRLESKKEYGIGAPQLSAHCKSCLNNGKYRDYAEALEKAGLAWWFNLNIPLLAVHVHPVRNIESFPVSFRIKVMLGITDPASSQQDIEQLYQEAMEKTDLESACAAAGAGVHQILNSGREFDRLETWHNRIKLLLCAPGLESALARASLIGFQGLIEIFYLSNLHHASRSFKKALDLAEEAESISLRLWFLTAIGYCQVWIGDFAQVELIMFDARALAALPDASMIAKTLYFVLNALFQAVRGDLVESRRPLTEIIQNPAFSYMPESIWMTAHAHLLLSSAMEGLDDEVERISKIIQTRALPAKNHYFHGYVHFCMGVVQLINNKAYRARLHCLEGLKRGGKAQSPHVERLSALLLGQALSDLKEDDEALELFSTWTQTWKKLDYRLFLSTGYLEMATIYLRRSAHGVAENYYRCAMDLFQDGEVPYSLFRPSSFPENLKKTLSIINVEVTGSYETSDSAVRILTFGEFEVDIMGRTLYDRKWRGGRTKQLLKALIVFGGNRIQSDLILDLLWPDAEGDKAAGALNVAISRLRKIGLEKNEKPLPWIEVGDRRISLSAEYCWIDSISFKRAMNEVNAQSKDRRKLKRALDLYRGDFLARDMNEPWIARHREILREEFIRGILTYSEICFDGEGFEEAERYLLRGLEINPMHEGLYALLMRCYLKMGFPSNSIRIFKQAQSILNDELGVSPGPVLRGLLREAEDV